MSRRFIIISIIGALILAIIVGLLIWAKSIQNRTNQEAVTLTPAIKKISAERVISPVPASVTEGVWYFNSEGRLFRINLDGSGLTEYPLPALNNPIQKIFWPKSGQDFIAVSLGSSAQTKSYYSSQQKIYINLPANMKSLDWLPDNRRIAYIWESGDHQRQQLAVANADGTGFVTVKEVFWPDLQVKVSPDGKTALLYRSALSGNVNKIYSVNLGTGEITTVIETGKNLEVVWISPNRFLFTQSAITAYPKLFVYDMVAKQATDLELTTSLDKVTMDQTGNMLYAAVPNKDGSGDMFVTEDLVNFRKNDYFTPTQQTFARNLMLISGRLYFVNTSDGLLYQISN